MPVKPLSDRLTDSNVIFKQHKETLRASRMPDQVCLNCSCMTELTELKCPVVTWPPVCSFGQCARWQLRQKHLQLSTAPLRLNRGGAALPVLLIHHFAWLLQSSSRLQFSLEVLHIQTDNHVCSEANTETGRKHVQVMMNANVFYLHILRMVTFGETAAVYLNMDLHFRVS